MSFDINHVKKMSLYGQTIIDYNYEFKLRTFEKLFWLCIIFKVLVMTTQIVLNFTFPRVII